MSRRSPIPGLPPSTAPAHERRTAAYRLLGVDPNEVATGTRFTPFFRRLPGGIDFALDSLRACDLPEARRFIRYYDNLIFPEFIRKVLPLEAFAIAANVSADQMINAVTYAVRTRAAQLGSITAALAHAEIVQASTSIALDPDSPVATEHMMANLKHMQFLPAAKGSHVNVQVNTSAQAGSTAASQSLPAPSPEASIRRLTQSFRDDSPAKELPAATAEYIPAEFTTDGADPIPVNATQARRAAERRARAVEADE